MVPASQQVTHHGHVSSTSSSAGTSTRAYSALRAQHTAHAPEGAQGHMPLVRHWFLVLPRAHACARIGARAGTLCPRAGGVPPRDYVPGGHYVPVPPMRALLL